MKIATVMLMLCTLMTATLAQDLGQITQLKEMYLDTALVAGNQPACIIVPPDDPQYMPLAQKLADAIRQAYGVAPPITPAGQVTDRMRQDSNLIALGIFANNQVVEDLYLREFVICDYNFPGGDDSHVIRTVHNPWLTGTNVVYLGSTELAGCGAAVDRFIEILSDHPDGAVGPIIEVVKQGQPAEPPSETWVADEHKRIDAQSAQMTMYQMAMSYANSYFLTGQPAYAKLLLSAMRRLDHLHETQSDVASTANCQWIFLYFDTIEEGPAFTDEERLELTNLFYRFACRLREAQSLMEPLSRSMGNKVMTFVYAGVYFSRYYRDLDVGKTLLANAETMHAPDMNNWKPPEDDLRYRQLTTVRSLKYSLIRPDPRYIENGLLRKSADYEMIVTNNRGNGAGFGDGSGISSRSRLAEVLPMAAWMYKDGRYLWWWDQFAEDPTAVPGDFYRPRGQGLMGWVPPERLPRVQPDELLGITRAPLDQWLYDRSDVSAALGTTWEQTRTFPIEDCFDKVSFRAGFEREDQYLLLSGIGYGYHSHPDANAVINYCDQGETLLYDDGYMIPQPSEHNTVVVLRDGWTEGIPELAQVITDLDTETVGLFRSRLSNYSGVDWDRTVIWPKSRYFLIVDDLQARDAADYTFQCIWRALGKADLQGRRWVSDKSPARMNMIDASDAVLTQKPSAGLNNNAPPFPIDQARKLVQSASLQMQPGDSYQFANLLYTTADTGQVQQVEMYRVDDTTSYLIEDDGKLALAGINRSDCVPGVTIQAQVFHLLEGTLTAGGATSIAVGGPLLSASAPVDVQLDLVSGQATVQVRQTAQVTITDPQGQTTQQLEPGHHSLTLRLADTPTLEQVAERMRADFTRLAVAQPADTKPQPGEGENVVGLWEHSYPVTDEHREAATRARRTHLLQVAETGDDGRHMTLVSGMDNAVHAIGPDGHTLWRYELPDIIHDLKMAVGNGVRQVLAACNDSNIYSLLPDGSLNWAVAPPPRSYARPGYREGDIQTHQGRPLSLVAADLNNDGSIEIVTGVHCGHIFCFDQDGNLLWDGISHTPHSMSEAAACDLTGDGNLEVVVGSVYSRAHVFDATGSRIGTGGGSNHAGATTLVCADLDGDGKGEIIAGDRLGKIWLQAQAADGSWAPWANTITYDTGSDITIVAAADLTGDGTMETAAASRNFLLYLFDGDRRPLWSLNLGDVCVDLDIADLTGDGRAEIVCAMEDGSVKIVSAEGRVVGWYQLPAPAQSVRVCELDGNPNSAEIVVSCDNGTVYALQVRM